MSATREEPDYREMIQHYVDDGFSVEAIAETNSASAERLRGFLNGNGHLSQQEGFQIGRWLGEQMQAEEIDRKAAVERHGPSANWRTCKDIYEGR